jgi:anti-sigma-K factor RskA
MSDRDRRAADAQHERWSEDVAAYLLGALDEEELAAFESHLEGCEKCRSELRWMRTAVEALPEAVPRLEAPPQLRAALMKEVRADARAQVRDSRSGEAVASGERRVQGRTSFRGWLARLGGSRFGWKPVAAVAAIALAVVAVAGYEVGNGGGGSSSAKISTYTAPKPVEGIEAKVVSDGEQGVVRLTDVKQLPDDRVLEAWVLRGGAVEPVRALFVPDKAGHAATTIADMKGVETVMVTREPKGGSPAPTSAPIATVPITS